MPAAGRELGRLRREAHLWKAWTERIDDAAIRAAYLTVLGDDERARADRCRAGSSRRLSVVGHALVRLSLSRYRPVAPAAWRFDRSPSGRPEIADPPSTGLCFNLSHTAGLAACLVTDGVPCGVDVERVRRAAARVARAARLLSGEEARLLAALPAAERGHRFFVHWTLKEAYLKARGIGIGVELDQVRFEVEPDGAARIRFGPELADDERAWQLYWAMPSPQHALAVALRAGATPRRIVAMDCDIEPPELA